MSSSDTRQNIHALVDRLPPEDLAALEGALSIRVNLVFGSLKNAPVDDEPVTEEEEQAVRRSEEWFEKNGGKGIPMEELLAEFGLSMKDFPLDKRGA
ncbi:MAG: hypothetical protein ACRD34_02905 [Bryobacteraceae bacterium]